MKKLTIADKPTKRIVTARVPHGVTPQLVISIHPGGLIGLRELGRRKEYRLDAAELYVSCICREVAANRKGRK